MPIDNAAVFRSMAERISKNDAPEFGGAALILPPGGGDPIEILLIDPKQDIASFWGTVQGKVAVAVAEMQDKQQNPFGMRR